MTSDILAYTKPNAMVVLRDAKARRCAKAFTAEGVEAYPRVLRWRPQAVELNGFDHLARALLAAARLGDAIVIRGGIAPDLVLPADGVYRRMVGGGLPDAIWTPCARQWFALDCDGVDGPDALDPWDLLRGLLPEFLRDHSFVGQLTSSAGVSPGVRARLWFWLDQPVTDGHLRAFAWPEALKVDVALFNAVQPHYVAAPSFVGREDPAPGAARWRACAGLAGDVVPADALLAVRPAPASAALPVYDFPAANPDEVAVRIERIRKSTTTGSRHHHALGAACELVAVGLPPELVEAEVDDLIRRQGREPSTGEGASIVQAAVQRQLAGTMTMRNPPVASVLAQADAAAPVATADEAEAGPEVDGDDIVGESPPGMAMYGANDWLNAATYRREVHPDGSFIRWGQQDWKWTGRHWKAEGSENLTSDIQKHTGLKDTRAAATARSFRSLMLRKDLNPPCMVDGNPLINVLHFANGVLDIDAWLLDPSAELLPHSPERFNTCSLTYDYDPAARAPRFEAFVRSVWPTQLDQAREFQKMLGYLLLQDNRFQKLFILNGAKRSGKGTILRLIEHLVGEQNHCSPNLTGLSNDFGLHALLGKSVATIGEANTQDLVPDAAIDRIKSISGGDRVPVNRKNKDELHVYLPVRFVFACNRLPAFLDASGALAARMVLFTFENSFEGREDFDLGRDLEAELPGIAQFALAGLRMLLVEDGRFIPAGSSKRTLAEFRAAQAPTPTFLLEHVQTGNAETWLSTKVLYQTYKTWCAEHGHRPVSEAKLAMELSELFPSAANASTSRRVGTGANRERLKSHFRFTPEGLELAGQALGGFDDAPP